VELVSVGVVTEAVVVVGVTMVELVSVGVTTDVPVAAIGAVDDVPVVATVSVAETSLVEVAAVSVSVAGVSAWSRLQAAIRTRQSKLTNNLRIEQLSFGEMGRQNAGRAERWLVALLLAVAVLRIAATYTVFSQTADEGMHLLTGLEVLKEHHYEIQLQNPPLPRVILALAPALAGAHYDTTKDPYPQATKVFHSTGRYKTLLVLARAGNLVFFLLGALATWAWARRELGPLGGIAALFFFTTQPSILGHAGLATLDVPGVAGFAICMLAFSRWLELPSMRRTVVLGLAYGLSILCKLLCIAYVPIACAAIYAVRLIRDAEVRARWRSLFRVAVVLPIALLVIWAGYGFSFGKVPTLNITAPAPSLVLGLAQMMEVNRFGFPGYALGRVGTEGWWWYFPLALALKTTLASLIVAAAGALLARKERGYLEPLAAAAAILVFSMPTNVNIGIRYILPIYVPLSLCAAAAVVAVAESRGLAVSGWLLRMTASSGQLETPRPRDPETKDRKFPQVAIAILVAWHLIASFVAHPDYMAYFNEIAGRSPSRYLIDSNLDWGQDILRLRDELRRRKIDHVGLALFSAEDLDAIGFPRHHDVDASTPTQGWIAVSEGVYRTSRAYGEWKWLVGRKYEKVGKSIRLYYIP